MEEEVVDEMKGKMGKSPGLVVNTIYRKEYLTSFFKQGWHK